MINEPEIILDKTDLHILRLMQENARISNADLARELGMIAYCYIQAKRS